MCTAVSNSVVDRHVLQCLAVLLIDMCTAVSNSVVDRHVLQCLTVLLIDMY